jgi:Protein of unknown function (DUF2589)
MPINMGDQFKGLPMGDLIGGPLMAACDAQVKLASATADFIKMVGFTPPDSAGKSDVRQVQFVFDRPATAALPGTQAPTDGTVLTERVELQVPLLAIIRVPALFINTVDVVFDMEVKNSETQKESFDATAKMSAEAKVGWGPFALKVNLSGSVSSHKENTRQSDQSAKYHVEVHAQDTGMPEGLARVMDLINSSVAPRKVGAPTATPAPVQLPVTPAQPEG